MFSMTDKNMQTDRFDGVRCLTISLLKHRKLEYIEEFHAL
jgi:hypothetical protein